MLMLRLDLQYFAGEKTEKATPKKRQDSRKKGQVLKSQDVTSAIVLLAVFLFMFFFAGFLRNEIFTFFNVTFTKYMLMNTVTIEIALEIYKDMLMEMAFILLPIMLVAVVAAIAANFFSLGCSLRLSP